MAFPIPSHLPRKSAPQDVSTKILSKIDAAMPKTLNSALTTSWLVELDESIQATKERIHEHVQGDVSAFERQLATAKSVQARLATLTTQIEVLNNSVSDPETGLVPTLVQNLTRHAELEQEALNASVELDALSRLLRLTKTFTSLEAYIERGELPGAVELCRELDRLLQDTPAHLSETQVIRDSRSKFRAAQSRTEEQLNEAYTRAVVISQHQFTIFPSVQVRRSATKLTLPSILSSLPRNFLVDHLTTLRRDLTIHFIDRVLRESTSISVSSAEHKITLSVSPCAEAPSTSLENLSTVFNFISSHFFPLLPPPERRTFPLSLCRPATTSLVNNVLIASLPPSFGTLPEYLELANQCVAFEEKFVVGTFGNDPNDRPVKAWAEGLGGHYERQRRLLTLDHARQIIVSQDGPTNASFVELEVTQEVAPQDTLWHQGESTARIGDGLDGVSEDAKDDAWGFDDDLSPGAAPEEDSWGFEDDDVPEHAASEHMESEPAEPGPQQGSGESTAISEINNEEPDPSEAWGWNEGGNEELTEETAWDDPWAEDSTLIESTKETESHPPPEPSISSVPVLKAATRLEKFANKGKKHLNGTSASSVPSPDIPTSRPLFQSPPTPHSTTSATVLPHSAPLDTRRQPTIARNLPKESYAVSLRTKRIISLVEDVLEEGKQFIASSPTPSSSVFPGSTILLTAPSVLDLHRALYPVTFEKQVALPEGGMRFSNDCFYLVLAIERIQLRLSGDVARVVGGRLEECAHSYKVLSDSWYHDVIRDRQDFIDTIMRTGAEGFTDTGDQDHYDECEAAVMRALQEVRRFSQDIKGVLTKSKYYTAIGRVANAALSRVSYDILALVDIPEVESHRLSELCRILHAVEGLFVEDPAEPSFVVAYVPLWLRFSYLSELLEASMADITYLFEVGALVDFQIDELVRLVRALFADTALRTNTITKLLEGHPVPS